MITKIQYNYICTTSGGFLKKFSLLVDERGHTLWEGSMGSIFDSISEVEMHLLTNYKDVLLVSKATTVVEKIEKSIQLEMKVFNKKEQWCKCGGIYSKPEELFCSKCKNPIA
jgi:hypothetical protein